MIVLRPRCFGSLVISSRSFLAAAPGSGSGWAARSSATTSSCNVICTLSPASFRTCRTSSGSRLLASLIEIFILTPGERQEECTALYTIGQ